MITITKAHGVPFPKPQATLKCSEELKDLGEGEITHSVLPILVSGGLKSNGYNLEKSC